MKNYVLILMLFSSTCIAQHLDNTFHYNGNHKIEISNFANHATFGQTKMVLQSNQKIILAGVLKDTSLANESKIQLIRLTKDGFIDSTFGTNGITQLFLDTLYLHYSLNAVVIGVQSNDKIVIASNLLKPNTFQESTWMWSRLNTDGQLDTTFANHGFYYLPRPIGTPKYFTNSIILPNDDILLINSAKTGEIAKLKMNGVIDSSFGNNGFAANPSYPQIYTISKGIAQPDGKIVLVGQTQTTSNRFYLSRLLPNGLIDSAFGTNGSMTVKIDSINAALSLALQDDGRILVVGRSSDTTTSTLLLGDSIKAVILRFTKDGQPDLSFNQTGFAFLDNVISFQWTEYSDVHMLNPNHILVTGNYQTNGNQLAFMLANYHLNGTLDSTFGTNGILKTIEVDSINWCSSSLLQGSDKILLNGESRHFMNYNGNKPMVARYTLDINLGLLQKETPQGQLVIFPNPIKEQANLRYTLSKAEKISIQLLDMQGRIVQHFISNQQEVSGEHQIRLIFNSEITPGNYIVQVSAPSIQQQIQITKISD